MDEETRTDFERRIHTEMKTEVSRAVIEIDSITADFSRRDLFSSGPHFKAITNSLSKAIASTVSRAWDVLTESILMSNVAYSDNLTSELKSIVQRQVPSTLFLPTLKRKALEIGCPELVDGSQEQVARSWFLAMELIRSKIDVFVQGRKRGTLSAQPPPVLQYLAWFRLHGRPHWKVCLIGFAVWAAIFFLGYLAGRLAGD